MSRVEENPARWLAHGGSLAVSLAAHTALLLWLLQANLAGNGAALPSLAAISIELVKPPPPLPPPPQPAEDVKPDLKPVKRAQPKRAAPPLPKEEPGPPVHEISTKDDEWVAARVNKNKGFVIGARRVPSDYAEKVKGQVIANMRYPADALYPAPRGYKGDMKALIQQCHIAYEITIDRNGNMLSYKFEPCGNEKLDIAADEALRKSGPFPPPPDLGAESYVIYGAQIFRTK